MKATIISLGLVLIGGLGVLITGDLAIAESPVKSQKLAKVEKAQTEKLREYERLINSLTDKDRVVQEDAKKKLIALGDKAIPILKECLNNKDWYKRFQVIGVLNEIEEIESTKLLMKVAVNKDEEEKIRVFAVRGLENRDVESNILISLLNDENFSIRQEVMMRDLIKENTKDIKLINTLKNRLFTEKHWQIKEWIVTKLSKLHNLEPKKKVECLLKVLREQYRNPIIVNEGGGEGGRTGSITGSVYIYDFVYIGQPAIPLIKKELEKEKDNEIKEAMIIILGLLKNKEVFSSLCDMVLTSKDAWKRGIAARALGEFEDKMAIPVLKKALKDPFYEEKGGCLRHPSPYEYMDIEYPVREDAFFSLLKLGVKVKRKGTGPKEYHEYEIIGE